MRRARRIGFTILEIIVALTIIVVLSVVILSSGELVGGASIGNQERWTAASLVLDDIARAINLRHQTKPAESFSQTVLRNPSRLSQLTKPITTTDLNSCDIAYTSTEVASWKGPYYLRELPASGNFKVEDGFLTEDTLQRVPPTGSLGPYTPTSPAPPAVLNIFMLNVTPEDAQGLSETVDGDASGTKGAVRFTLNGSNPITVIYRVEISGC